MGRHSAVRKTNSVETSSTSGSASSFNIPEAVQDIGDQTMTRRKQSGRRRFARAVSAVAAAGILLAGANSVNDGTPTNTAASEGAPSDSGSGNQGSEKHPSKSEPAKPELNCDLQGAGRPDETSGGKVFELTLVNDAEPDAYDVVTYDAKANKYQSSSMKVGVYDASNRTFDSSSFEIKDGANQVPAVVVPEDVITEGLNIVIYAQKGEKTELCGGFNYSDTSGVSIGSNGPDSDFLPSLPNV